MSKQPEPARRRAKPKDNGGAGGSAGEIAARAEAAASALSRRAENAGRVARAYELGAEGEWLTAQALAELTALGWHVVHDRVVPGGGNIDHVVVGPAGVFVLDSKNWSGAPSIGRRGELRVGGRAREREVARAVDMAARVQGIVSPAASSVPVRPVLVLASEEGADLTARQLESGPIVVGVAHVAEALRALPQSCAPGQADALLTATLAGFPAMGEAVHSPGPGHDENDAPVGSFFYKGNVILFVEPWNRSGHRRLYLNDADGSTIGYRDLRTDETVVVDSTQAELVEGVLRDVKDGRVRLALPHLPNVPTGLPGGRLLGRLGLWRNFLIGHHWRGGGKDRLYVTQAVPGQGIFDLGYVDLATRSIHPTSDEPLGKDLGPPRRYLKVMLERYPRGASSEGGRSS